MSGVVIKKPDSHRREYAFVQLENGLKAIVGSDPGCDKAGASLCVNVGMCHERKDLPGLAHFLEHMLFTGTRKFPKEGEYREFIDQNGGCANAYTLCYLTNFMFEISPDKLTPALDRFSRFFYEPLLTKECTDREINAVDSEFHGGMTHPWWRYIGIMNQSANPEHPFHVACGNNKVLRDLPKERGIDLYDEMVKLYESCYSAGGMTLVIIGRESVAELTAVVKTMFGAIADRGVQMPIGDSHGAGRPPFLPTDWNALILQNPVQDIKDVVFSWVLPYQGGCWRSKPAQYVRHLLGHAGAGSLTSVLKQRGLITENTVGDGAWLEGSFSLLNITLDLTDKGLEHIEEIGMYVFAYIAMLQRTPPQQWIFDEMRKLAELQFKFGEDQHPFELCQDMSVALQRFPPQEVLSGRSQMYEFDPVGIAGVLSKLTLDGVRVWHRAKCLAARCVERDTSYDSPMARLPLEQSWRKAWAAAACAGGDSGEAATAYCASLGLHLPTPNPFIPEDLSLRPLPADPPQLPKAVPGLEPPMACLFHRQDDLLKQPKALASFLLYTPFLYQDVESFVKTDLFCRCVAESLTEYAHDAEMAGVFYSCSVGFSCVNVQIGGFNDKLGVLLDAVTDKIMSMREIPQGIYDIVAAAYGDEVSNAAFHAKPTAQSAQRFTELTSKGGVFPFYKRHAVFRSMTREHLTGVVDEIFPASGFHIEGLVLGNVLPEEAKALAQRLVRRFGISRALNALPERAEALLPEGATVWKLNGTDEEDPNHAVVMRVQLPHTVEIEMLARLLSKVLGAKFFDVLRTQQQLGYIVHSVSRCTMKFVYLISVVQTEFPPDYVRSCIEAFFEEHYTWIEEALTEGEFEACRAGLLSELQASHKSLGEEAAHYFGSIVDRTYDFERRGREIEYVAKVARLARLKQFVTEQVRRAPKMFVQVRKASPREDKPLPDGAAIPADPEGLRVWTTHADIVQSFAASATWLPVPSEVGEAASRP